MSPSIHALFQPLRRFWRRAHGSATVEFVIMFPLVMSMLIMGAEAGWTAVQRISLERAMDLTVREVRLGNLPAHTTHDEFRARVCERSILLGNCNEQLLLEMRRIDTTHWAFPAQRNECIDLAENIIPITAFSVGSENSVMYLRACYLVRPIFPTTTLGLQLPLDASGMYALRTTTGFVNE